MPSSQTPQKILLIQLRQLGDILLTTPCIREIKRERPTAHLTVLTHRMGRLILEGNPWVDTHLIQSTDDGLRSAFSLLHHLRRLQFDLVIDCMNNPRSAIATWATRAPHRLSFHSTRALAYTQTIPRPEVSPYIVREKFALLRAAGFSPVSEALNLPWSEQDAQVVGRLDQDDKPFHVAAIRVALSPTHRREARRWPIERWARLADRLVTDWNAHVIWLWGPGEEEFIDRTMAGCRHQTLKAPRTSFRELTALIANTDLFIGNSNGPSHLAVATNVPSLQLHGPTQATAWCPMNERHAAIQSPTSQLTPMTSMEGIAEDAVWSALNTMRAVVNAQAELRHAAGLLRGWQS